MDELRRADSLCYLAIINNFSKGIKDNRNRVMALHIDEINIRPSLSFNNKHIFLGASYNNPQKEASSMLVFLLSSITNFQGPINGLSFPVTDLDSEYLCTQLEKVLKKLLKLTLRLFQSSSTV